MQCCLCQYSVLYVSCVVVVVQCGEQGRAVLQGVVSVVEEEAKVSRQEISAVLEAEIKTR